MKNIRARWKSLLVTALAVIPIAFGVIQLVPVDRTNPSIANEPAWDSPQTRILADKACFDCHSNETRWPWYAKIAPVSWLTVHDVDEGRSEFNFSDWDAHPISVDEMAEVINEGEMPPWYYAIMHSDAQLSDQEKADLISGLRATFSQATSDNPAD